MVIFSVSFQFFLGQRGCANLLCIVSILKIKIINNKLLINQKMRNASRICVSSLRRGHANLLCIVPILVCA